MSDAPSYEARPPGDLIREELKEREWTQDDLARILGRPLAAVSEIIMGKRSITTQTARELAAAFGTSPDLWLNLEAAYQLARQPEPLLDIKRRARIFERAPVKDMERRGWIKPTASNAGLESELCRFFRVSSIDDEPTIGLAAKQSVSSEELTPAQVAWCYRALHLSMAVQAAPYSQKKLKDALPELRTLASQSASIRRVPRFLSELGIRLVVVEHLPRTKIDGAALWLDEHRPVIALSLRYGRMDSFWHSLGHELSHVLNEDSVSLDIDLTGQSHSSWSVRPTIENRANAQAAAMLIDPSELDTFILRVKPLFSKAKIVQFSNRLRIHPSIVVGQLQHRGEIDWRANREMLIDIRDGIVGQAITDGFGHCPEV
jgi:HTH-type transcriptional regulator / antitoxin HigA